METPTTDEQMKQEEIGRFSAVLLSVGIEERSSKILLFVVLTIVFVSAFVSFLLLSPFGFPKGNIISIKSGASLNDVSLMLKGENIIRSQNLFEFCAKIVGGTKPILAGQYLFKEPISACAVAYRIAYGISGIPAVRVTIPEGMSNKEIALSLAPKLSKFDSAFFIDYARAKEGYLFPDTYFFTDMVVAQGVLMIMNDNFNKKIEPWSGAIEASGRTLREIIIMASILEKEATTEEDKAIVSGILWKRISKGIPLQVDAAFMYLLGKKSSELSAADLQIKSAYNTYRNKGLPAGPIGNPGIVAIRAAIQPTVSPYFYYLSDKDGIIHYAKTFKEHIANKAKYLK
ncbi:MAG: endolytic transglycosylase MltG [Candidatus Yonathbacteria bacterium]|nr:endolytic transglycosylase MltG [Candidatus Yonathbacteria bacterium]